MNFVLPSHAPIHYWCAAIYLLVCANKSSIHLIIKLERLKHYYLKKKKKNLEISFFFEFFPKKIKYSIFYNYRFRTINQNSFVPIFDNEVARKKYIDLSRTLGVAVSKTIFISDFLSVFSSDLVYVSLFMYVS